MSGEGRPGPFRCICRDCQRLDKGLRCLAESPQNNFRIFKNGHLVYTEGNHKSVLDRIANEVFSIDSTHSEKR